MVTYFIGFILILSGCDWGRVSDGFMYVCGGGVEMVWLLRNVYLDIFVEKIYCPSVTFIRNSPKEGATFKL